MSDPSANVLQEKLAQAGRLLKTLTEEKRHFSQENERLTQQYQQAHATNQTLVELLEKATLTSPAETLPDVSTPERLQEYRQQVDGRLDKRSEQISSPVVSNTSETGRLDVEDVCSCLSSILSNAENCTLDTTMPPQLLTLFEDVRNQLQEKQQSLQRSEQDRQHIVQDAQKDLKRQVTELQIQVNTLNEEKEELATQVADGKQTAEVTEQLQKRLEETEREKAASMAQVALLQKEHQALLEKLAGIRTTLERKLARLPAVESERDELRTKVGKLEQSLQETQVALDQQDQATAEKLAQKDQMNDVLRRHLEDIQHDHEQQQVTLRQLESEYSQLSSKLIVSQNDMDKLKAKLSEEEESHRQDRICLDNLQSVLEEFETTKETEIRASVERVEKQLEATKISCDEYKERAETAEGSLEEARHDVSQTQRFEKEVKEKNLLIGKLRHEAIILNEHLVEAMRRLKEETSENNVDRQLITNLLVGFLSAPHGDRRRYDILSIIARVLQMSDDQKEMIGMIRSKSDSGLRRVPSYPGGQLGVPSDEAVPEFPRESFTDAWISFLLKESNPTHLLRRTASSSASGSTTPTYPPPPSPSI